MHRLNQSALPANVAVRTAGYESDFHSSREFRRFFGAPPRLQTWQLAEFPKKDENTLQEVCAGRKLCWKNPADSPFCLL